MTIINLVLAADQAFLLTDTALSEPGPESSALPSNGRTGKVLTCPELGMVIAGCGSWFLTVQVRQSILGWPAIGGIEDLAREAPRHFRQLAVEKSSSDTTIIAVGMVGEACLAYSFASPDFEPMALTLGMHFHPIIPAGTHVVGDFELLIPKDDEVQSSSVDLAPTPAPTTAPTLAPRAPSFSAESRKASVAAQIQARLNPTSCGGKIVATWLDCGGIRQAVVGEC